MENKDILLDLLVNELVTNHLISIDPTKIGQVKQIVAKYAFYATEGPRRGPDADRKPLSIAEAHAAAAMGPRQDGPTFSEMTVHPKELERIKTDREASENGPTDPTLDENRQTAPYENTQSVAFGDAPKPNSETAHQNAATPAERQGPAMNEIGPVSYTNPAPLVDEPKEGL
jgi:hypothetical protein